MKCLEIAHFQNHKKRPYFRFMKRKKYIGYLEDILKFGMRNKLIHQLSS